MGSLGSLQLLRRYPLVNPLHAVVLFFHWWFGYCPTVCAFYWILQGEPENAAPYLTGGTVCILIVAFGLVLYALGARAVLGIWRPQLMSAAAPEGFSYRTGTLLRLGLAAGLAGLSIWLLGIFGLQAFETVNYLGGQSTKTWWLVPLDEAGHLIDFALAAGCSLLALPRLKSSPFTRCTALAIAVFAVSRAVTSGSKGPLIFPVFYYVVAYTTWRRRAPWLALFLGLVAFLTFVEPFVASMRLRVERTGQATVADRREIFLDGLKNFSPSDLFGHQLNIESLFRGIYPLAVKTTAQSTLFSGPWRGESLRDGLSAILPRALFPAKASSNMGNYFAHQLSVADAGDNLQNVAITIPFEFTGNFGWIAGSLSFALLGAVWALFVALLLTPARMATHPLTPFVIVFGLGIESSVGQFGNGIKMLLILLPLLFLICRFPRRANLLHSCR